MPKEAFQIPEIDEVRIHFQAIQPKWPDKFCEYYANRFWNHYQSNGWLVSGKSKMKDWKAACRGQWFVLKYKEDMEMLIQLQPKPRQNFFLASEVKSKQPVGDMTLDFMDEVLEEYIKHPTLVSKARLAGCYDWMKENGLMKLTAEQKQLAVNEGTQDICRGKALAVQFVMEKMQMNLLSFKDIFRVPKH